MWFDRLEDIKNSNETTKTNKMKKNLIVAFQIFLVPVSILALIFLIVGIVWLLWFLWGISKILAIGSFLIIAYLIILLLVIVLNLGED